jgi:hypothetical protein
MRFNLTGVDNNQLPPYVVKLHSFLKKLLPLIVPVFHFLSGREGFSDSMSDSDGTC